MKCFFWFCFIGIFASSLLADDVDALRTKRDRLVERGMWRDALSFYQNQLMAVTDSGSGSDLSSAVKSLQSLNAWNELDDLLEEAVDSHADNSDLLVRAAQVYDWAPHHGRLVAGVFERGGGYGRRPMGENFDSGGSVGQTVDSTFRDFVRSMQLARQAIEVKSAAKDQEKAWAAIVQLLQGRESWKFQSLTQLSHLPKWDEPGPEGGTEGAPWDKDGPVLYRLAASWDSAINDGERWRFALDEQAKLATTNSAAAILARADFSRAQFGSETLSSHWRPAQDPDEVEGILATESLEEDECLAKTSDGVRRFKLLPEFHFIALYRSILDDKGLGGTAGDRLCDVFLTRGQYAQANNVLEKTIAKHGKGNDDSRTKLHQQITGNWGRFEPVSTVAAGSRPRLPLVFRNATQITLTAAPVDMSAVVDDTMDYLKRGGGLDWERANPGSIAGRLIKEQNSKYLGPTAAKWNATLTPRDRYRDTRTDLEVPVDRAGAWWIQATMPNGNSFCTLVWIVDSVFLEKGMAGTKQWWLADAVDGAPIKGVEVEFFGFRTVNLAQTNAMGRRTENRTKQFKRATDDDGRVVLKVTDFDPEMQWMAVARRNGSPPNISGFESIFAQDDGNLNGSRDITYAVSDRPIYKPGDQVHLKYFFRNVGYSDPNEEAFSNKQGTLLVQNGRGDEVIKLEKLKTDALGTVESDWMIPKDAALGNWNAAFMIGDRIASAVSFRVEEYRKPEYEVKVEAPTEPVKLGEKFKITVLANYFHGSPVRNAMVDVVVKRSSIGDRWFPCGRWDWLYGAGSWWNSSQADWHPSWKSWGCIPPNPPWWGQERWTPDELVSNFHVPIGFDGKAVIEIDTAMSKRIHGDLDAKYTIEARVVDASRREERGIGTVIVARKPFEVVVWLDRGYAHAGDEVMVAVSAANLSGKPVADAKGRLSLFLLASGNGGRVDEREVNSFAVVTDRQGEVHHRFAAPPVGQYRVAVSLTSTCGDHVDGAVILNVHGSGRTNSKDWHFGALEIVADKATYASGEIAKLRVNSDHENAHVWLFQKSSDVDEHEARRIQLEGKSLEVEVPVNRRDMPNLFIEGVTVHDAKVHTAVRQILVPPAGQALDVVLEAAKAEVKPQEESSLRITVRDAEGKPFIGIATLSVYDKSLEAITGGSNVGSIQENFWGWKNLYSQNIRDFLPLASGCLIKPNTIGMQALGVFGFERSKGNRAMERGRSMGQMVKGAASMLMEVQDQMAAPTAMPIAVRKEFADLLKWSGRIQTDSNGCAEIPLKFPDNLTTWKARVWVLGAGTQVGEGTAEFITSKKLFVRMQAPRFMIERDESVFSAVIQNENDEAKSVNVSLELDGNLLEIVSGAAQSVQIAGHHEMRVDWRVRALQEGEATIRMRAMTQDDGDVVERKMPVKVHGMMRQDAWSRMVSPNEASAKILIDVPEQRRPELSKLTVRYSPTVAGAVVDAIPYLASDGNGCTEQTLNRFVPLMVARKMLQRLKVNLAEIKAMRSSLNPQEIGGSGATAVEWKQWQTNPVFDEVEMEQMTERGIERLGGMQNTDGGWGWFSGFGDASYPHTTSVVVHGLVVAKSLGAKVPDAILASGVHWLIAYEKSQLNALTLHKDREALRRAGKPVPKSNNFEKQQCDATDALVRQVLGGSGSESEGMLDLLYRDRIDLPIYAKCLVGLELMRKGDVVRRDEVVQLVGQFLRHDSENQTAYLDLGDSNPWWNWYGSETEANAWFLKLLSGTRPDSADARGVVKYLVNRRNHGGRWSSTRESAYAIEAIGDYLLASGEDKPEMEVEVLIDGKSLQHQMIRKENLFALNHTVVLKGDLVTTGNHVIEIRRTGKGALYGNAFLDVFTQEDRLRSAGLEVKVSRRLSKLIPDAGENQVPDSRGHLATQQVERFKREVLKDGDHLMSGDRIEVELVVESKNDYEYLIFSDAKGAGFEALDSQGGYVMGENGMSVYRESRDQAVNFFIRALPRGKCSIKYQLRAETPGIYKALPATVDAMYAPELRGNSDDVCLEITQ